MGWLRPFLHILMSKPDRLKTSSKFCGAPVDAEQYERESGFASRHVNQTGSVWLNARRVVMTSHGALSWRHKTHLGPNLRRFLKHPKLLRISWIFCVNPAGTEMLPLSRRRNSRHHGRPMSTSWDWAKQNALFTNPEKAPCDRLLELYLI